MEAQVARLRAMLDGATPGVIDTAETTWRKNADALEVVRSRLTTGSTQLEGQLGDGARVAAQTALTNAADHSRQRREAMKRGADALRDAARAIRSAQTVRDALDSEGPPSSPTMPDNYSTMKPDDQIRAERVFSTKLGTYNSAVADREERARVAADALDRDLRTSNDVIRELNPERQTGPGSMGGSTGATGTPVAYRGNPRLTGRRPEDDGGEPEVEVVPEEPGTGPELGPEPGGPEAEPVGPGGDGELAGPGTVQPIGGGTGTPGGGGAGSPGATPASPGSSAGAAAGAGAAAAAAAAARSGAARSAAAPAGRPAAPIGAGARSSSPGTLGRSGAAAGAAGAGRGGAARGAGAAGAGRGTGGSRTGAAAAGSRSGSRAGAAGAGRSAAGKAGAAGAGSRTGRSKAAEAARSAGSRGQGAAGAAGSGRRKDDEQDVEREHLLAERDIWIDDDEVAPQVLD